MSVKATRNRFELDALSVLRPSGEATVAASAASDNYITLDQLTSYWDAGTNANKEEFGAHFQIESIGAASGTPTAQFSIQVDYSTAFAEPVTVVTTEVASAAGYRTALVSKEGLLEALATLGVGIANPVPVYLRAYLTIGGGATTPAVAWNAYLAPING